MKKSYQTPTLHLVMLQQQAQLLQNTAPQGKFSNEGPAGGWDAGGAASRQDGWDDENTP